VIMGDVTADWPATKNWDLDYLASAAGDKIVPVYSSKPAVDNESQYEPARKLPLRDYLHLLKNGESDLRMFFYDILKEAPIFLKDFSYPSIGLRFLKRLPVLFVGGRGTKVQMHYDVDMADLVLCHFGGTKHVLLIPPEQERFLYRVPFSFSALHAVDLSDPDYETFPALKHLSPMVAILEHGDALYIPSGFWHYIIYEEIGFSLTLRALPSSPKKVLKMLKNIFFVRIVEGIMRKLVGQKWNDRNERLAVEKTHRQLTKEGLI